MVVSYDTLPYWVVTPAAVFVCAEVQDSDRGPSPPEAHGVPRRRRPRRDHEGQGVVLDDEEGLRGAWHPRAREERRLSELSARRGAPGLPPVCYPSGTLVDGLCRGGGKGRVGRSGRRRAMSGVVAARRLGSGRTWVGREGGRPAENLMYIYILVSCSQDSLRTANDGARRRTVCMCVCVCVRARVCVCTWLGYVERI